MKKKIRVIVKYPAGHSYTYKYEEGELFCPECGKQTVWEETSPGDFYVGANFACTSCGSIWTMQLREQKWYKDAPEFQILEQLRKANETIPPKP